jgi:hypothetical protein
MYHIINPRGRIFIASTAPHSKVDVLANKSIYTTKWPPLLVAWWVRYVSPYYRPFFEAKDRFILFGLPFLLDVPYNQSPWKDLHRFDSAAQQG